MSVQLSIIIVAYNSNEVLLPCLSSLDKYNPIGKELEVIVVDNHPVDGLKELLAEQTLNFGVKYTENPANDGFGAGNNRGVEIASAPVVFFLNPDTVLVEDVITPTLAKIAANADEVVGYTLTDVEGRPNNAFSYLPEYLFVFPLFHLMEKISLTWFVNNVGFMNRIVWPWGAAFALSKDRFVEAGSFDEHIFLCNEEPDLMRRLPRRHVTILPNKIIHLEGHGREVPVARYLAYLTSLNYYMKKYRVTGQGLFWGLFRFKQNLKRMLRKGRPDNLDLAFAKFKEQNAKS